jgi:hypothetical protein
MLRRLCSFKEKTEEKMRRGVKEKDLRHKMPSTQRKI